LWLACIGWGGLIALGAQVPGSPEKRRVVHLADVDGIIHPIAAQHVARAVREADAADAELLVLRMDTPGGLVDSARAINSSIIASPRPVCVFVGPSGVRAASAGFLITMAADVAAMAPGTHLGAAHPVSGSGEKLDDTTAKKAAQDVAADVRSITAHRGRNVALAEAAVLESRSFTEREALDATPPLIDLVANDVNDLLKKLDGRTVVRWDGTKQVLATAGAEVVPIEMTWPQRFLSALAHPQVAYLLFSLGTLGLTIELWNPGSILPGVVGGICLLLAFFAFSILPVNYAGLLLIFFGLLLLILEVKITSFGLLAAGGIVSLVLGSLMLIDAPIPELRLGLGFVLPIVLGLSAIVLFLVNLAVKALRSRTVTGPSGMIGEIGRALTDIAPGGAGSVAVHGEIWSAAAGEPIVRGDEVVVTEVNGLRLEVRTARTAETGGVRPPGG
jgi:membrane-bound serine protease (ClpP class)